MEYMDFNERDIVFFNENGETVRNLDEQAKYISSIEISGRVSIPGGYVKRAFRHDVQRALRSAIAVNGPSEIGIQMDVEQELADKGYKAECTIFSMKRVIYPVGEKLSEFDLIKPKKADDFEKGDE